MPHGGYSIVANRLKDRISGITGNKVKAAARYLDLNPNNEILLECCIFLKESNVTLSNHVIDYSKKEKAG